MTFGDGPAGPRRRSASELGVGQAAIERGPVNAITDATGVRVGHTTLVEGASIRTGVTAIVPDAVDRAGGGLPAGLYVGNGFGKLIGATQLVEQHVLSAITGARSGPVTQGCVGAGTGTAALGFKAGIGTASRRLGLPDGEPGLVGVLVQANFSGTLTVDGVRIEPQAALSQAARQDDYSGGNSAMIIVAVDRALDSRQLTRVARRAVLAMADVGSEFSPYSGDYAIAFATADGSQVPEDALGHIFAAVTEATAEAILNSLFLATTTTGHQGHTKQAVPLDSVLQAAERARSTAPEPR